jgi:uncharacterized protein YutE (UPF0331/DUF86 family)
MSPEVTRRKLVLLTQYLSELKKYKGVSDTEFVKNHFAIERLLQLIVEIASDINAHILSEKGHPPPKDYYDSFIQLGAHQTLPTDLATALAPAAGLRNALVHAYEEIDQEQVKKSIEFVFTYFPKYIEHIQTAYKL